MKTTFVKGHCGWDSVTLIPAGDVPASRQLEIALRVMAAPYQGGLEVGFIGPGDGPNELRLRVADSTSRDWISMCGGMTQVIGKALVETSLRERLGIDFSAQPCTVKLLTDSAIVPIEIEIHDGKVVRVTTIMDGYVAYLYQLGVEPIVLDGVPALATADFVVFDIEALETRYPGLDFARRDPGPHLHAVNELLRDFGRRRGCAGVNGMLYDARPEGPGRFRVFPRFLSDDLAAASIPYEFQCGTGTVAVGIALAGLGLIGDGEVLLEWGSRRATPDPYGIRTSQLGVCVHERRVTAARFSHSVVEILAEGTLFLPEG
jgi:hypothetical protein